MKAQNERNKVLKKLDRLAFETPNDAVKLAFFDEEKGIPSGLNDLDLTMLAGVKRSANGAIELKLVDRLELLKLLLDELDGGEESRGEAFLRAISGADDDRSDDDRGDDD